MHSIANTVPGALVELLRRQPLSPGKVQFAWGLAVGPAVQRATSVRLESGKLLVDAVDAQWSREIRRSTGVILPRLRSMLGPDAVSAIEVRQRT